MSFVLWLSTAAYGLVAFGLGLWFGYRWGWNDATDGRRQR